MATTTVTLTLTVESVTHLSFDHVTNLGIVVNEKIINILLNPEYDKSNYGLSITTEKT